MKRKYEEENIKIVDGSLKKNESWVTDAPVLLTSLELAVSLSKYLFYLFDLYHLYYRNISPTSLWGIIDYYL